MIFNGIEKEYVVTLTGRRRSAWAPVSRTFVTVPGMPGAYLSQTETQIREIVVPVLIKSDNIEDLQKTKEDMAEWLIHDEPKELIFKDEPDRVYYALVDGELELDEIFSTGQGEITFICPDPYKYGKELEVDFPSDSAVIENPGTAEADPIFELTAKEKTTFAMIANENDEYNMIGILVDDDQSEVVDEKVLVLREEGDGIGDWTYSPTRIDPPNVSGVISNGTMVYDGSGIIVDDYGDPPSEWNGYGPAIIRELPEAIQDFELTTVIDTRTDLKEENFRVEIYLFDENLNMLGKMGIRDRLRNFHNRSGLARVGEYEDSVTRYLIGENSYDHNDFGKSSMFFLRWTRVGKTFEFYIAQVVNGRHQDTITRRYTDNSGEWTGRAKYVQIYIRTYKGRANPYLARVNNINIYKLTQIEEDQTPYILDDGDVVTFDHVNGDILVNGESRMDLKDFGGRFFKLMKGYNTITTLPDGAFDAKVRFRPRYK